MGIHNIEYSRNYGFWNEEEQEHLANSKVAIAGVGGDGFQLGLKLAMMGVGHLNIADPEVFERENSNRVLGATRKNEGHSKAEVFKEVIHEIRPDTSVDIYEDGVTEDNVEEFMNTADLVLDESELTYLQIGTMIARTARNNNTPNLMVMNIGFSGLATSFHPNHGKTFEDVMGIPKNAPLDEIRDMKVDFSRCLPYIPNYGDITTLIAVQEGASLPSISQGVDVASAIGTTEAFLHLTTNVGNRRKQPTWAPRFRYMDAYNGESGVVRNPRFAHYLGLIALLGRSQLGLNPRTSYRKEDRDRRANILNQTLSN